MSTGLVQIDSDIEKALTKFIRDALNNNSFGVVFSLGYWYNSNTRDEMGKEYIKVENDNPFDYEKKNVVPMTVEQFDGNITALEGIFNAEYALPLTFQIDVNDEDHFDRVINAINEVKNNHRAQLRRLPVDIRDGDGNITSTENFNTVMTTDNLTPDGDVEPIQGTRYVFGRMTFFFDISKDILYGNHVIMKLSDYNTDGTIKDTVRLFPINPSMKRSNSPESFQNFDTTQVQQVIKETSYSVDLALYMEDKDIFWSLMEYLVIMEKMHTEFLLTIEFYGSDYDGIDTYDATTNPNGAKPRLTFSENVIITDGEPMFTIGEPMFLQMSLSKAILKKN